MLSTCPLKNNRKMAYIPLCREGGKLIEKINLHIFTLYIVKEGTNGVPCVKGVN